MISLKELKMSAGLKVRTLVVFILRNEIEEPKSDICEHRNFDNSDAD